jgi:hypothetical protein
MINYFAGNAGDFFCSIICYELQLSDEILWRLIIDQLKALHPPLRARS